MNPRFKGLKALATGSFLCLWAHTLKSFEPFVALTEKLLSLTSIFGRRVVREPRRAVPGVRGGLLGLHDDDGRRGGAAGAGAGFRRWHCSGHLRPHPHGNLQAALAGAASL